VPMLCCRSSSPISTPTAKRLHHPPGGVKHCLNSKIAACRLQIRDKRSGSAEVVETRAVPPSRS
jgi:hypothetical protein